MTFTGLYADTPVSIVSTGIGTDNTEIALIESFQVPESDTVTYTRVGSCGGLKAHIALRDLVISSGAVRLENTSTYFVEERYSAVAHYELLMALVAAAEGTGYPFHVGLTASGSGSCGAQARDVAGVPPRYPGLPEQLARRNVLTFEMESSTLFTPCSLRGVRAGTVYAVYASRPAKTSIGHEARSDAETRCLRVGLEAVRILKRMDKQKARRSIRYWFPSQ